MAEHARHTRITNRGDSGVCWSRRVDVKANPYGKPSYVPDFLTNTIILATSMVRSLSPRHLGKASHRHRKMGFAFLVENWKTPGPVVDQKEDGPREVNHVNIQ